MSTITKPAPISESPIPRASPTRPESPLPGAPPTEPQPTYTYTYTDSPDTTQWTISTRTLTRTRTRTSSRLFAEIEGATTMATSTSELYPSTITFSEIISPSTSSDSTTTTDSITTAITTEPYTSTLITATTITIILPSTATTYSTTRSTTSWTYSRSTTTAPVGLTFPPTPRPSNGSDKLSAAAIVAIAVASVVGIIALALCTFQIVHRQRRNRDCVHYQNTPPMQETRPNNYGGGGGGEGGGGGQVNNSNDGTGLGIISSNTNTPHGEGDFRVPQEQMDASSLDNGGGFSSQSSGFGYDNGVGFATALGAGMYGYDDDHRYQQQALHQQRAHHPYYSSLNNQPLTYTPPTEPDIAPEDRYDPTYASRREQEAAYMNYQQQQLYLQSQQQQQKQLQKQQLQQQQYLAGQLPMPVPVIPSTTTEPFATRPTVIGDGSQEDYYPENRVSVNSQTYLERLRGSYPPSAIDRGLMGVPFTESGDGNSVVNNNARTPSPGLTPSLPVPVPVSVPPISSHVGAGTAGNMTGSEDYAYPESDARRVPPDNRRPSPSIPTSSSTVDIPAVTVQANDQDQSAIHNDTAVAAGTAQGELTSPNRSTEGEGGATESSNNNNARSSKRSSVLSQASSTASNSLKPKRLNPPQLVPSSKGAPQVRYPEEEPTITMITREPK